MTKKASDTLRVNMAWKGQELANLQECAELLRLNDEATTIRYLVARGVEAMATQLHSRRMFARLEKQFSPQELLPFMQKLTEGVKE